MNTRYCPACGFRHNWQIEKPKICAKCTQDMDAAFTSASAPTNNVVIPPVQEKRPHRRFYDARGNDITDRFASKAPPVPHYEENDEDYVDENQQQILAQQLASTISAEDFGLSIDEEAKQSSVRLASILQQAAANGRAAKPTKKRGKAKS